MISSNVTGVAKQLFTIGNDLWVTVEIIKGHMRELHYMYLSVPDYLVCVCVFSSSRGYDVTRLLFKLSLAN